MKTKILLFFAVFWVSIAFLRAATSVVVPGGLANVEGNSTVNDFMTASSFRMQMVFDASQFGFLSSSPGVTNIVNSISFRPDGASSGDVLSVFGGGSVTLSTTLRGPDNLSSVFADNIGADAVTVYSGGVTFGGSYFPGQSPQPFGNSLIATTPFNYIPSHGNLLVDIRGVSGHVLLPGALDSQTAVGDSASRVLALSNLATAGTPDTLGLVARLNISVVPEPATWVLVSLGILLIAVAKFRRNYGA